MTSPEQASNNNHETIEVSQYPFTYLSKAYAIVTHAIRIIGFISLL